MERTNEPPDRTSTDETRDLALNAILPTADRLGIAHFLLVKRLRAVMEDLGKLKALGASETEAVAYVEAIASHIHGLYSGPHATDTRVAERMHLDADIAQDHFRGVCKLEGSDSASVLEAQARFVEKESQAGAVFARALRRDARRLRASSQTARQRVGLVGGTG